MLQYIVLFIFSKKFVRNKRVSSTYLHARKQTKNFVYEHDFFRRLENVDFLHLFASNSLSARARRFLWVVVKRSFRYERAFSQSEKLCTRKRTVEQDALFEY